MANQSPDLTGDTRRRDREMLAIACLVVVGSLVLQVEQNVQVALAWMPEVVVPPLCMPREWFGITCPGCGLTRSCIHLAHGRWEAAQQAHRLGWLVAGAVLVQIPYRLHKLYRPQSLLVSPQASKRFGQGLIAMLLINWVLETLVHA
jgi:hypothetical protein